MKVEWISRQVYTSAITIHNNNITLNKTAANYFNDAYGALVGIDREDGFLVIKYIGLDDINEKHVNKKSIHPVQIKASYGRITGKKLIDELSQYFTLDFSNKNVYKYGAKWDVVEKELVIDMKGSGNYE